MADKYTVNELAMCLRSLVRVTRTELEIKSCGEELEWKE